MKKQDYINFILKHDTYYLMNSWNISRGYSIKVKIYSMGFNKDIETFAYSCLDVGSFYNGINDILEDKTEYLKEKYKRNNRSNISIGFNGRSGGYLVLYGLLNKYMGSQIYDEYYLRQMSLTDIKDIYNLLKDFDSLKQEIKEYVEDLYKNNTIEEEVINIPKKIKVLKEK